MQTAYLILAHNNPQLINRAIGVLSSDSCAFFIHIDQKSNIEDFSSIRGENVFFSKERIPVYWGEFSQVEAILLLLRQAIESPQNFDYFVLVSGSDYPLRSGKYVNTFLEENRGGEFIDLVKMPAPGKPISRISTLRFPSDKPVRRFATRALAKLGFAQRDYKKHLGGLDPYSGSTWWGLTRGACQYVLMFMECNPRITKYFRNVFAPDEGFFHTILGNSGFASRIKGGMFYADWSAQGPHPGTISIQHLAFFESQEKIILKDMYGSREVLFARKLSDDDLGLIDRIDEMIQKKKF